MMYPSWSSGPAQLYTSRRGQRKRQQNVQHQKTSRPRSAQPSSHGGTRQRGCGEAGNPLTTAFQALPGMEQQFFEAAQSVRSYDLVLNLLEREVKREARKRAGRTAQSAAVFLITAGLIILATLGFAAALLLMRCRP